MLYQKGVLSKRVIQVVSVIQVVYKIQIARMVHVPVGSVRWYLQPPPVSPGTVMLASSPRLTVMLNCWTAAEQS